MHWVRIAVTSTDLQCIMSAAVAFIRKTSTNPLISHVFSFALCGRGSLSNSLIKEKLRAILPEKYFE